MSLQTSFEGEDVYCDRTQPPYPAVVAELKRYDPRLFVRWNRSQGYFEVWRWAPAHPIPAHPQPHDIRTKAAPQFTILASDFDRRVIRRLYMTDFARYSPTLNPDEINREMERIEEVKEAKEDRVLEDACMDWAQDNARGMQRDIKDVFSGMSRK